MNHVIMNQHKAIEIKRLEHESYFQSRLMQSGDNCSHIVSYYDFLVKSLRDSLWDSCKANFIDLALSRDFTACQPVKMRAFVEFGSDKQKPRKVKSQIIIGNLDYRVKFEC